MYFHLSDNNTPTSKDTQDIKIVLKHIITYLPKWLIM